MSETGHARNIDGANKVISVLESWGTDYNPAKASLKLPAFKAQVAAAEADQATYLATQRTNKNDKNTRKTEFAPLKKFGTRILGAIKSSDASEATIADAEGYIRKLRGERADKGGDNAATPAPPPSTGNSGDNEHSVSQQSYSNLIEHLKGLHAITTTETSYAPNEADLKPTAIAALATRLDTLNKAENKSFTKMGNARISRNKRLYAPKTGILDTVEAIKSYAQSLYGAGSPQMKQLTAIKFKQITD